MATTTPNFGWPVPTSTDLVKDGATAIEGLGDAVDASLLDLKGGTSGQVLAKNSNTDMDFIWVAQDDSNAIQNTIVDAKGDLIAATAADTPARLAVGTNGQVLTADSTASTGLVWAAAAGGGLTLSQIATGTLSSTSVTISSLSSYDRILLKVTGMNPSGNTTPNIRINNNSGANYQRIMLGQASGTSGSDYQSGLTEYYIGGAIGETQSGNTANAYWVYFENCKSAGFTNVSHSCFYYNGSSKESGFSNGIYTVAEAVSSLVFRANGVITFSAGSYTVWGG